MFSGEGLESLLFSRKAAQDLAGVDTVLDLQVWGNCVWVKGCISGKTIVKFLGKRQFKEKFANDRKARSRAIQVQVNLYNPWEYIAVSSKGEKRYKVNLWHKGITCTCPDFKVMEQLITGPKCCKHGYAVLRQLGYSNLSEWINRGEHNG